MSTTESVKPLNETILRYLVPNEADRTALIDGTLDPSKASITDTEESFDAAIDAMARSDNPDFQEASTRYKRIFHPKGTAFSQHARVNVDAIIAARAATSRASSGSNPTCEKGTVVKESDFRDSIDALKAQGDSPTKDNCCGGGVAVCGPLLAQNGTASISLCGEQKQCMGCAELAGLMDGVVKTCVVDGSLGGANGTIDGRDGLSYEVSIGST